ncbi:MAG: hypothetical protein B6I34_09380 [Anaerolineaceae bacterium 4572_32.1]|nr:MAG: hypothetical protein B6I34_09380 [Anaerolineaceae bacterium 4572_32.1]
MDGYHGKLLWVDLGDGRVRDESLRADYVESFIGGSGLAIRYLYDLIDADTDPLGPDNPLIFMRPRRASRTSWATSACAWAVSDRPVRTACCSRASFTITPAPPPAPDWAR